LASDNRDARAPLVAIVGPTGTRKTALSLELARFADVEIVNADSRQVYRYMDIGTAKPKPEELRAVPHHLVDIAAPDEDFSLSHYLRAARGAVADIQGRGKLPVLVGGTGQYVWALLEGWQAPEVSPDPALRERLEARARTEGHSVLYTELLQLDPEAADFIDQRNVRRVIRALEVIERTGRRFSSQRAKASPGWDVTVVGLTMRREELYARLDARVDGMLADGWVEEVRRLISLGYSPRSPAFSSVGYRELADHLQGGGDLESAVERIRSATHQLVRRQYTWFRLGDPRIRWTDLSTCGWADAVERVKSLAALKA
jgi:tRNA dimethylallyltransferase